MRAVNKKLHKLACMRPLKEGGGWHQRRGIMPGVVRHAAVVGGHAPGARIASRRRSRHYPAAK